MVNNREGKVVVVLTNKQHALVIELIRGEINSIEAHFESGHIQIGTGEWSGLEGKLQDMHKLLKLFHKI